MLRKAVTVLLVVALALIGLSPLGAASAGAMAAGPALPPPCCADCDQPDLPDDLGCHALAACTAAPSLAAPASGFVAVLDAMRLALRAPDQAPAPSRATAPPLRPPRSPILA